jgi:hypothetical protein
VVVFPAGNVVTVKLADVSPPGMVTLAGTLAVRGRLLCTLIVTPTVGAGLASVTVPTEDVPPGTLVGLAVSDVNAGRLGYNVNGCVNVTSPPDTEIVTVVGAVTRAVVMLKKPIPLTAATVAESGTAASAGLLLVTCTV